MMVAIGNFFFRYRNLLFPVVFVWMLFEGTWPCVRDERAQAILIVAGFLAALAGQTLRAVTVGLAYIKRGGKDKKVYADRLVTEGMFAHCRNPLYVGNILIVVGVGVASNSLPFVVVGVPFFLFAYRSIVAAEEKFLGEKFGAQFEGYCRSVGRFSLSLRGFGETWRSMEFHWRRLVVKEYQTPFLWMTGFAFLMMKRSYVHFGYDAGKQTLWLLSAWCMALGAAFLFAWCLKKTKVIRAD